MSRIELERVVLIDHIDKPLNKSGASPGMDKVFERNPKMGRWACRLYWDGPVVQIVDPESEEVEEVPLHFVRQMRRYKERGKAEKK